MTLFSLTVTPVQIIYAKIAIIVYNKKNARSVDL